MNAVLNWNESLVQSIKMDTMQGKSRAVCGEMWAVVCSQIMEKEAHHLITQRTSIDPVRHWAVTSPRALQLTHHDWYQDGKHIQSNGG